MNCMLSQTNELWCKTIRRISNETDLIVEGSIFNGQYFMYLTTRGYVMYDILNAKSQEVRIISSQGTCKYIAFMNFNLIGCSNTFNKTFELRSIQPDSRLATLFIKPNIYSMQIDYQEGSQYVFLAGEYTIDIVSLRTSETIGQITSNLTRRSDKQFKICGDFMIVTSQALNAFEQYDVKDPTNVIRIQGQISLDTYGLKLVENVRTKFEKGCAIAWPLVVTDG